MASEQVVCGIRGCSEVGCTARCQSEAVLRQYFSFPSFRPGQLEAILPVLHNKDVFVRMATGSGKTLCMFVPVLAVKEGMGVIVSPLNGLMDQQVRNLSVGSG